MHEKFLKSILEQDRAPIVVCDLNSVIVYMNASAKKEYHKDLTGSDLKKCHNDASNEKIDMVLSFFRESEDNNIIFTYHSDEENKDVYMVALRDDNRKLIGFYEKHEFRNRETMNPYEAVMK